MPPEIKSVAQAWHQRYSYLPLGPRTLDRDQFSEITVIHWNRIGALNGHASWAAQHEIPTTLTRGSYARQVHVLAGQDYRPCSTYHPYECASEGIPFPICSRHPQPRKLEGLKTETEKDMGLDPYDPPFPELSCTLERFEGKMRLGVSESPQTPRLAVLPISK